MAIRDDIIRMTDRVPEQWVIKINNQPYNPGNKESCPTEALARSILFEDSGRLAHPLVLEDGVTPHTAEYWSAMETKNAEIKAELQAMLDDGTITITKLIPAPGP